MIPKENSTQDLQKHHLKVIPDSSSLAIQNELSYSVNPLLIHLILPLKTVILNATCKVQNDSTCNFSVFSPALVAVSL